MAVPTFELDASGAGITRGERRPTVEIPTLLVIVAAYGGWLAITLAYRHWPLALVAPIAKLATAAAAKATRLIVMRSPGA